jgi:hypothetical protein
MVIAHQKINGITVCATTKAMVKLLIATYGKAGCFFTMERTTSSKIAAGLPKRHARINQINQIDTSDKFLNELTGNLAGHRLYRQLSSRYAVPKKH